MAETHGRQVTDGDWRFASLKRPSAASHHKGKQANTSPHRNEKSPQIAGFCRALLAMDGASDDPYGVPKFFEFAAF
jgi:hypothetical protein